MKRALAKYALVGALVASLLPAIANADALTQLARPFETALAEGQFAWALVLIFVAGLATSLTPCVYPMITITVSVFGARQASSKLEAALVSSAFVLGIAAFFTPLGIISALGGYALGSSLANPWVLTLLALFFIAMAASMFGFFEIKLPSFLQNRLAQVGGSGMRGSFLLGLVSGVIAAPCTGPVLAVLLAWVATTQSPIFGALSLFVYSLGLGVLFWAVGTFAVLLPKSGKWLNAIKSIFGMLMLVMAWYFVRNLIAFPPWLTTQSALLGAVITILFGIAIGAIGLSFREGTRAQKARKWIGVLACTLGAIIALESIPSVEAKAEATIQWRDDYNQARSEALAEHKPLLVDFGADWCGACQELEKLTLSDPQVVRAAERFIAVRIDLSADQATPEKWKLLEKYKQPGLPLVVLHDQQGQEVARVTGVVEPEEFLALMRKVR